MKNLWSKSRVVILLIFGFIAVAHAQQQLLQLGSSSYTKSAAPNMRQSANLSPRFFRGVGGVAFNSVASGRNGLNLSSISYVPSNTDGQRLHVKMIDKTGAERSFRPVIYDWELVPLAKFANSEYGSAMTLFGELEDKGFETTLHQEGAQIMNYHEALEDTLLGLRLMQADLLLIDEDAVDLPRMGDQYILGAGEQKPDLAKNKVALSRVQIQLMLNNLTAGQDFDSYVVGDLDTDVEFGEKEGKLVFYGTPTWTFWRDTDDTSNMLKEVQNAQETIAAGLQSGRFKSDNEATRYFMSRLGKETVAEYEAYLKRETPVEQLPALSKKLTSAIKQEGGINPTIYKAVTKAMHYRALFKAYQQNNPAGFNHFLQSLDSVKVIPTIFTPTIRRPKLLN